MLMFLLFKRGGGGVERGGDDTYDSFPARPFFANWVLCVYGDTYSKSRDQPGRVANPPRGQLNKEN